MTDKPQWRFEKLLNGWIVAPPKLRIYRGVRLIRATGCWEWQGARVKSGYGVIRVQRQLAAHRFAFEAFVGPIPDGMYVCHHCDNPPCCNPEHLYLGTPKQNSRDRDVRGRDNHFRKINADRAAEVGRRAAAGEIVKSLASEYGISEIRVYHLKLNQVRVVEGRVNE